MEKTFPNNEETSVSSNENHHQNSNKNGKFLPPVYVYPLGGQGEVGKNCYAVEMGNEIYVIDSGIKFASESIAIEGTIPSFEYLIRNQEKIKGLIITHGHEDHIGAVPHILHQVKFPVIYAGRLSGALVDAKIRERRVAKPKVIVINNKSYIKSRNFEINFFNVIHSTPDSFGLEIKTKHGVIVSTGDFKFDFSPVGTRADLYKMASLGKDNVSLLVSDSTNSEVDRWSPSESVVSQRINNVVKNAKGRIVVTTFASNVYRVREIIEIALRHNRKIAIFGWSMDKVVSISRKIKYINAPDKNFIQDREIKNYKDNEILVLCTGGQGEISAALSKMADGRHSDVKFHNGDTVVFATNAIPGNFEAVEKLTNKLVKLGVNIFDNTNTPGVHTSGHAGKTEQMLMLNLIRPKYFMPIHGETKMLVAHGKTAVECGVKKENIFIVPNGGRIKLVNGEVTVAGYVPAEDIYVDDTNLTGQSNKVISDRTRMAKNGIATITIGINSKENKIIFNPNFESKGIFNEKANNDFIKMIENEILNTLNDYYKTTSKITFSGIKDVVRLKTEELIFDKKRVNPIVVPIILNLDSNKETISD